MAGISPLSSRTNSFKVREKGKRTVSCCLKPQYGRKVSYGKKWTLQVWNLVKWVGKLGWWKDKLEYARWVVYPPLRPLPRYLLMQPLPSYSASHLNLHTCNTCLPTNLVYTYKKRRRRARDSCFSSFRIVTVSPVVVTRWPLHQLSHRSSFAARLLTVVLDMR